MASRLSGYGGGVAAAVCFKAPEPRRPHLQRCPISPVPKRVRGGDTIDGIQAEVEKRSPAAGGWFRRRSAVTKGRHALQYGKQTGGV